MRVTLEQDVLVMLQVLVFDKLLIRNLFEEEFEQAFRKRIYIVTDIDLILVKEYEFTTNFPTTS